MAVNSTPAAAATPAPRTGGGVNPLIRQLGLADLAKRDAPDKLPEAEVNIEDENVPELVGHVRLAWQKNKLAKVVIDRKLLACLRARRQMYSAAEVAQVQQSGGGMNLVFTDLTETKCRAASAWLCDILLPAGEQPWGVDPTPLPDLPQPLRNQVVQKALVEAQQVMQQTAQAGGGVMDPQAFRDLTKDIGIKIRAEVEEEYQQAAKLRAKRMEKVIADRLAEGNYQAAMDGFIEDFVTYPAAILKGPTYKRHRRLSWTSDFKPKVTNDPIPWWERVSPFDAFPASNTTSPQKGDFIERIRFHRSDLYDLKGLPGYQDEQIDKALMDYSAGRLDNWMWTEAERQRLEQETMFMWLSPQGTIDALNYWGSVPGWKLMTWGVSGKDGEPLEPTQEYECNVLLCGSYVLYATLNPDPLHERPYWKACYDEIPGAFWGRSIPDLASVSQRMCNQFASAMADNMSMSSGPMVWVHADRFADGEQTMEIFPWKIWQLKSDPQAAGQAAPGIGFFQAADNSGSLMANYEKWEIKADDATGIPRYTYGNERAGGSADTASGLGMLMANAAKGLRRAISNVDLNAVSRTIGKTFINEMIYNPDTSIKGDCVVVPRGAAAILIKQAAQANRLQFLQMTANPIDAQIITAKFRAVILRETAAALELPAECVPTDEELEASQKAAAEGQQAAMAAQQQLEMDKIAAQGKVDLQVQLAREQAISRREGESQRNQVLANVVQEAVAKAMGTKEPAQAESTPA
jgi:hypothetical protein